MAGIDQVLERLITDAAFHDQLRTDPASALAAYELSKADLELLASRFEDGLGVQSAVEQRTSKSAVLGLLATGVGSTSDGELVQAPGDPPPPPDSGDSVGGHDFDIWQDNRGGEIESDTAGIDPAGIRLQQAHDPAASTGGADALVSDDADPPTEEEPLELPYLFDTEKKSYGSG